MCLHFLLQFPQLFSTSHWRDCDASSAFCHCSGLSTDSFVMFIFILFTVCFHQLNMKQALKRSDWLELSTLSHPNIKTQRTKDCRTNSERMIQTDDLKDKKWQKQYRTVLILIFFWKTLFSHTKTVIRQVSPAFPLGHFITHAFITPTRASSWWTSQLHHPSQCRSLAPHHN